MHFKPKFLIPVLFALLVFTACLPEGRVYEEHKELSPNVEWLREDARTFEVPLKASEGPYAISIALRYITGFPYKFMKVKLEVTSPDNQVQSEVFDLQVRTDEGEYLGEPGLDIWDSEHLVIPDFSPTKDGNYTFTITHAMPEKSVPAVMEIGLVVDQKKK